MTSSTTNSASGPGDPASGPEKHPDAKRKAPSAKRARHNRWRRISTWVTVVALIGFAVALVSFVGSLNTDTHAESTKSLLARIGAAIQSQASADGAPPETLDDLRPTASSGAIVREDAYGQIVQYKRVDGAPGFRLRSLGADGVPDTEDDLVWPVGDIWGR